MTTAPNPSVAALLARWPLFQPFATEDLERLATTGDTLQVALGERILRRGEPCRHLHVVLRGRARFSRGMDSVQRVTQGAGPGDLPKRRKDTVQRVTLGAAGPGDLLGDETLAPPETSAATCIAAEPTLLYRLPRECVLNLIGQLPEVDLRLPSVLCLHRLVQRLADERFLGLRGPEEFHDLMNALRSRQFPAGTPLTTAGMRGDTWLAVSAGTISVSVEGQRGPDLGPGATFGVEGLLDLDSRADLGAVTDVVCWCLAAADFQRLYPAAESRSAILSKGLAPSWVGQRGAADCGAAALTMAMRHRGRRVAVEDVHKQLVLSERGAHLTALTRTAEAFGLRARAVQVGPEGLAGLPLPGVALLEAEHFVVVYGWKGETVLIGDPAKGMAAWDLAKFLSQWSGHFLCLEDVQR